MAFEIRASADGGAYSEPSLTVVSGDELVIYGRRSSDDPTSATFGAVSMTEVEDALGIGPYGSMWYLQNVDNSPGTGSQACAGTGGSTRGSVACVITECATTTPIRVSDTATGSGTTGQSATLSGTVSGDLVIGTVINGTYTTGVNFSAESGTTLVDEGQADNHTCAMFSKVATGSSTTLNFALDVSDAWGMHIVSVKPAAAAATALPAMMQHYYRKGLRLVNGIWQPPKNIWTPGPVPAFEGEI